MKQGMKLFAAVVITAVTVVVPATIMAQSIALTPGIISTLAGSGTAGEPSNGSASTSNLEPAYAIAVAPIISGVGGDVYFSESTNYVKVLYEGGAAAKAIIAANSAYTGTTTPTIGDIYLIAGNGTAGTTAVNATGYQAGSTQVIAPRGLATDSYGNLFISQTGTTSTGTLSTAAEVQVVYAGTISGQGTNPAAALITLENTTITSPIAGYIYNIAGGSSAYVSAGIAWKVALNSPRGIYVDSAEDLFIADYGDNEIKVVYNGGSQLATLLTAESYTGLVAGDMYILAGGATLVVADSGDGSVGFTGGANHVNGTPTISSNGPDAVGVNLTTGDVYIAEYGSNKIRKVNGTSAIVSTVLGPASGIAATAGGTGDGGLATSAQISSPRGIAVDAGGNVYISDTANSAIRKIDANGYVSTIAGTNGTASATGTGTNGDGGNATAATLKGQYDVKLDTNGNLIIADEGASKLRKVTVNASISGSLGTSVTSKGSFAFGNVNNSSSSSAVSALISNITGASVTPSSISIPFGYTQVAGGNSEAPDCSTSTAIPAGITCTLALEFAPLSAGLNSASATVTVGTDTVTVPMTGTGVAGSTSTSTSLAISPSSGPYTYGTTLTFTASVTPSAATGDVVFSDSIAGTLCTHTLSTGIATCSVSNLSINSGHNVTAAYAGNGTYAGSTSSAVAVNVVAPVAATSTTTITPSTTTPDLEASVTLSVSVSGSSSPLPSGTVTLTDNGVTLGTVTLSSGGGSFTTTNLPFGVNSITGSYVGDIYNNPSTSSTGIVTVSATRLAALPGVISTKIGNGTAGDSTTSPTGAATYYPTTVRVDAAGNVYYTDYGSVVRVYNPGSSTVTIAGTSILAGTVATIAGTGTACSSPTVSCGDGAAATAAQINIARGLTIDNYGNIYISDAGDNRVRVIYNGGSPLQGILSALGISSPTAGYIYTIAGNGTTLVGANGTLATSQGLNSPRNLLVDASGNVYIADYGNARVRVIFAGGTAVANFINAEIPTVITPAVGYLYTVGGIGGTTEAGDGGLASAAGMFGPSGLAFDPSNTNLYVLDFSGRALREISLLTGNISLVAGTEGVSGFAGDGGAATSSQLNSPRDLWVDWAGNIYIADSLNERIRMVNTSGIISTIAGYTSSTGDAVGDGGPATAAFINQPQSAVLDRSGNLLIADYYDSRIRSVSATTSTLVFPTTTVNSTSTLQTVLSNIGSASITLTGISSLPSGFTQTAGSGTNCSGTTTLASGQSCILQVAFTPTAASSYSGSVNVTSNTSTITINLSGYGGVASSIALTSNTYAVKAGGTATLTATVSGSSPSGTINFYYASPGSTQQIWFAMGTLSGGTVTTAATALPASPVGSYSFTAVYSGDTNNDPSTSSVITVVNGSTTTAISVPSTATEGQSITATVTVTGLGSGSPTGVVTLIATPSGGSPTTLLSGATLSSGVATYTGTLPSGADSLVATYSGDASNNASTSSVAIVTVSSGTQTITFTQPTSPVSYGVSPISLSATASSDLAVTFSVLSGPGTINGSVLTITGIGTIVVAADQSGNSSYSAAPEVTQSIVVSQATQTITFTQPVSPVNYGVAPISLSATGGASGNAVTFSVSSGPCSVSSNTLTITGVGTCVVAASQLGNTNYSAATQVTHNITVNTATATPAVSSSSYSIVPGTSVTLSAIVAGVTGGATPSGTVAFYTGSTLLGNQTLVAGRASLSTTALPLGSDSITINYSGDTDYASSTSSAVTVTVAYLSTATSLSTSTASVVPGQPLTLTAIVSGTGAGTPTGTVTFSSTSTGATQGVLGTATLNGSGVANYFGLIWGGSDVVTATYNGDANYGGSTSNTVAVANYPATGKLNFNWPFINWSQPINDGLCSTPWPVTIQNLTGVTIAAPALVFSGAGAADFQVNSNTCGSSLVQGASCTFNVEFCPLAAASGTTTANLSASTSTSANYSSSIPVTGIALSSSLTFNWPFLNFTPTVPVGATSAAWPVTLMNQSGTPTTLASPVVTFTDASFSIVSDSCSGQVLAPGASCMYSVVFSPLAADIITNGTNIISGIMTASGNSGAVTGTLNVGGWAGSALNFNWPFVTFQSVVQGATGANPWPVTVTNNSGQALSGITYTFTGVTNYVSGAFTLTNTCSTLAAGASCTFDIVPSPQSGQTAGAYSATLAVSGSGTSVSFSSTPLSVSGTAIAGGYSINWNQDQQAGVSTIDFGPQNTANEKAGPWPITVYNSTPSTQTLTLTPSLSQFTTDSSTCTNVASGSSCSFNLYFTPTADTSYQGNLTIAGGGFTCIINTWGGANK